VRLCLLGPVRLLAAGREIDLGAAKQRCVLAVLLAAPGHSVPVDVLVDRVWGTSPPRGANPVAAYVTRLRRALATAASSSDVPPIAITFAAGGYRVECPPGVIDLHDARQRVRRAREIRDAGDDRLSADLLGSVLLDWSPVALAGLTGDWAARVRDGLHRERLDLVAERAEALLRLGRHDEVVSEVRPLLVEHPDAEALAAPLLLALAAAGRVAEALAQYAVLRRALADELGVQPSLRLQDLHLGLLHADPEVVGRTSAGRRPTADAGRAHRGCRLSFHAGSSWASWSGTPPRTTRRTGSPSRRRVARS
jgi:DNA-binding SARP family transcriptional activator